MKNLKRSIANFLIVAMIVTMIPVFAFGAVTNISDFRDMPNDWSTDALQKAVTNGLISGFEENGWKYIKPNDNLTRAQMATIVNRAFGAVKLTTLSYVNDVPVNEWFAPEMAKAVKMGTFKMDTYMRPNDPITRQEAFTVLARALRLSDKNNKNSLYNFTDGNKVADFAREAVSAMIDGRYVAGSNGYLYPTANMSRAEFAKVMDNLIKDYSNQAGEVYSVSSFSGNLMINVPNITVKNTIIKGDLIIGDGVGTGNVTLDNVDVTGRTIIRGGGLNTVRIRSNSDIPSIIIAKVDGNVRVLVDSGGVIDLVNIDDGDDDVVLEGDFGTVNVNKTLPVYFVKAKVKLVQVMETSTINVDKDSVMDRINVVKTATGTKVVNAGIVTKLVSDIKVTVSGSGTVTENLATGGNVALSSIGTIEGVPKVGEVLTAGAIKPSGATVTYQWKRANTSNGTYSNISGATSNTYKAVVEDLNKFIKVIVTGKSNYTGTLTSNATTVVTASKITATTIVGVTPPVMGETPVSSLPATAEYTATIAWNPTSSPFAAATAYTATITLTAKTGYTLTGITVNQFKIAGATAVVNQANSATITATFPITGNTLATGLSPSIGPLSSPEEGRVMLTVSTAPQSGHKIYYRVVDSNPGTRTVGSMINLSTDSPTWAEVISQTAIKITAADGKYIEVVEVTDATKSITKWGKTGVTNDGFPVPVLASGLTIQIGAMSPAQEGKVQITSVSPVETGRKLYYKISDAALAPYIGDSIGLASWTSMEGTSVSEVVAIDGKFIQIVEVNMSDSKVTRWGVSAATDDGYTPPVAPTVISATTLGQTFIEVTMSSPLTNTIGDQAAFSINGAATALSVSAVSVSDTKVKLTLSGAMATGEIITISYAATGTNDLTNGVLVSNFTNQPVTNVI